MLHIYRLDRLYRVDSFRCRLHPQPPLLHPPQMLSARNQRHILTRLCHISADTPASTARTNYQIFQIIILLSLLILLFLSHENHLHNHQTWLKCCLPYFYNLTQHQTFPQVLHREVSVEHLESILYNNCKYLKGSSSVNETRTSLRDHCVSPQSWTDLCQHTGQAL